MKKCFFLILLVLFTAKPLSASDIALDDISSIKLNSILTQNSLGFTHLSFLVQAKKASKFEGIIDVKKAAEKSLEYFFLGLILRENTFLVNLNPDKPHSIINPVLSDTDLGKVLLNADLRLKEDVAGLLNPEVSKTGQEFWKRLWEKAEELGPVDKIPLLNRFWIIPGAVEITETDNQITIVKSSLKVCLESEISHYRELKDKALKELQDYGSKLMKELILPVIEKRVNEAYAYADLRDVFNAFILAKCYREKFNVNRDYLLQAVNFDIFKDLGSVFLYNQAEIYQDYLRSVTNTGYSFSETIVDPFSAVSVRRRYFSGGIDFGNIEVTRVNDSTQTQTAQADSYLTCDLYLPQGIQKPLQYAKNHLELTSGNSLQDRNPTALVKNLPAIAPTRLAEANMQSLNSIDRTEKVLLSKL